MTNAVADNMKLHEHQLNGLKIAEIASDEILIHNTEDAIQLLGVK
ncbi:hypothetical protein [Dyadobacter tibetensis]|nr:hypothetical protein [Dyadobacter tibetensis]